MSETSEVVKPVLEALRARGVLAYRNNSGGVKSGKRWVFYGLREGREKGSPDIVAILPGTGRAMFIECKKPGEKPTTEQLSWLLKAQCNGAYCCVVTSYEEVHAHLDSAAAGALSNLLEYRR